MPLKLQRVTSDRESLYESRRTSPFGIHHGVENVAQVEVIAEAEHLHPARIEDADHVLVEDVDLVAFLVHVDADPVVAEPARRNWTACRGTSPAPRRQRTCRERQQTRRQEHEGEGAPSRLRLRGTALP